MVSVLEKNTDLLHDWNYTLNGSPSSSITCKDKVWWFCDKCKQSYQRRVYSKLKNSKCPYCSGRKVCDMNCLATKYPEISKQWHPLKNGNLTSSDVTPGSERNVWWHCNVCNQDYQMIIKSKIGQKQKCPFCAGKRAYCGNNLITQRPDLVKFWHPLKNGNLKPEHVTAGSHTKVWWLCNICNESYKTDIHNKQKTGCPYCANKKAYSVNCLYTKCPEISRSWNYIKNGILTPKDVLVSSRKDVWWVCCSCKTDFLLKVNQITAGNKNLVLCRKCSSYYHEELCKQIMFEIFDKKFSKTKHFTLVNFRNKKLELDCFNEELKINIEYDGIQHYEYPNPFHSTETQFINQQKNDLCKDNWCLANGILNIRVSYLYISKDQIKEFIINKLKESGKL